MGIHGKGITDGCDEGVKEGSKDVMTEGTDDFQGTCPFCSETHSACDLI